MMKLTLATATLLGLALSAPGAHAQVEVTMTRSTAPGQEVLIWRHARWDSRCQFKAEPTLTITTTPAHGTLDMRPETFTITVPPANNTGRDCRGKSIAGTAVYYKPAAGFTGTDQFVYRTDPGSAESIQRSVTVTVK